MKTISRYIMTLALLLTAVTGAWAQSTLNLVELEVPAAWEGDFTALTAADFPADFVDYSTLTDDEAKAIPNPDPSYSHAVYVFYGFNETGIKYIVWVNGTQEVGNEAVPRLSLYGEAKANFSKIYYTASDAIEVAWNASTKTGTFAMPGSDVVLTPIYAAATVYGADGQTEKMAYETLKEAFANVQDGDVIKLDWNVTLTETLETPTIDGGVKFTLDFNGYTINGGTTYIIQLKNAGDQLTFTDSSDDQLGGLIAKELNTKAGSKFVFDAGRYNFSGTTAEIMNGLCANTSNPLSLAEGKEFIDLEGGAEANDGFTLSVGFKTFELAIGAGKFATFYAEQNVTVVEGTNISFYTIDAVDQAHTTATVAQYNSPVVPGNFPILVYNGSDNDQNVKLKVTTDPSTITAKMQSGAFQGTADDREFTADDMAAKDYYVLSGGSAFAPVKGKGTIAAHKCWLEFAKNNGNARSFKIVFDNGEATGVNEVIEVNEVSDDTLYDLNGRKLNGEPTRKGVYIQNGRKVVIK